MKITKKHLIKMADLVMRNLPYILLFTLVVKNLFFKSLTPDDYKLYTYVYGVMLLGMGILHKLEDLNFRRLKDVQNDSFETINDLFKKLLEEREENLLLKKEIEVMKRERGIK